MNEQEIIGFICALIRNIPSRKLNDKNLHVIDTKTGEDYGTLKEYISERMKTLFDANIAFR